MIIGSRIIAPEGFRGLKKGMVYYFLLSDSINNRVRFIQFGNSKSGVQAYLLTVSRVEFEEALEAGKLIEEKGSENYPPWLEPLQGISISELERRRVSKKKTYLEMVDSRYLAIAELVIRRKEILSAENPDAIINAHAKTQKPGQNAQRVRFWFYAYIVFGFDKWVLRPAFHNIGKWDREEKADITKFGRPSKWGKNHGFSVTSAMKPVILDGYIKYRSPSKTENEIYNEVITNEFGCISIMDKGCHSFIHPDGKPYPSFPQYVYWIEKLTEDKRAERERARKGQYKYKAKAGAEGSFAEHLFNLVQRVEFDGYNLVEKLSGITEGSIVDGFCVVRAVCGLSGAVVGIGFSHGKETMEAYKMCLFSMAINKKLFGELFGIKIEQSEWPCVGLSDNIVVDRGPAAGFPCKPEITWLGTFELPPTYSGQSKATVESSHPKKKKNLDQPTHFHSGLNFVEMAKREIFQVLKDNMSSDASDRMDEDLYFLGFTPTPLNIWKYYDEKGRTSAIDMNFDEAVRRFLTPHPASIKKDAVYFYGRKYRSIEIMGTGVFDRVARDGHIEVTAYAITMCVRHIWVELEGRLYQLNVVGKASARPGSSDICLQDLIKINEKRLEALALHREERRAVDQYYTDRFRENTGKDWNSGREKVGPAVKNAASQRDEADYLRYVGKKS
ncbi:transposase [Pseudomonas sp. BN411]|uniref:transposase n=1 Tax=Pseudomonas sp. BN411 TaxID=2567887 RepID=UPI002455BE72|nr:transposase [Pseudomonas sp. BN411]MDH4562882.1 transposase [Pseudomonas sp. BN411]